MNLVFGIRLAYSSALARLFGHMGHSHVDNGVTLVYSGMHWFMNWIKVKRWKQTLETEVNPGMSMKQTYFKLLKNKIRNLWYSHGMKQIIKMFEQWNCLHWIFCHHVSKHGPVFRAVAVITQLALENGEPLFGVTYNNHDHFEQCQ